MWKILRRTVFSTASEVVENKLNEHDELLRQLIEKRNKARPAFF